jgi:hypothetical protein
VGVGGIISLTGVIITDIVAGKMLGRSGGRDLDIWVGAVNLGGDWERWWQSRRNNMLVMHLWHHCILCTSSIVLRTGATHPANICTSS